MSLGWRNDGLWVEPVRIDTVLPPPAGPTLVVVVGSYFAASISGTAEDWLSPTLRLASNVVAVSMPEEGVFPPQFRWPLRFEVFVAKFLFLRSFAVLEEDLLALQLRPVANKQLKRKRF